MIEGLQFYTTNDVPSILCAYTFQIQANLDQFFCHLIIPSPFSAYTSATNFHCRNLQNWFTQGLKHRETIHAREVRRFNFIFLAALVLVKTLNYSGFSSHTGVGREQKHLDDARTALCVSKILVTVLIRVTLAEPFLMNLHRPSACLQVGRPRRRIPARANADLVFWPHKAEHRAAKRRWLRSPFRRFFSTRRDAIRKKEQARDDEWPGKRKRLYILR
jgi:hypothetical protein